MNTQLEKLFTLHNFSLKDKYDFLQVYTMLPSYKKVRVVENFDEIIGSLGKLRKELQSEQEILFGRALNNIEEKLSQIGKQGVMAGTKDKILLLKNMI